MSRAPKSTCNMLTRRPDLFGAVVCAVPLLLLGCDTLLRLPCLEGFKSAPRVVLDVYSAKERSTRSASRAASLREIRL